MPEANDEDEVEVAIIRGPGAKKFLAGLGGGDGDGGEEEFDEVEDEDGRTWRSPKDTGKGKLKVKQGGKSEEKKGLGAKFFSTG